MTYYSKCARCGRDGWQMPPVKGQTCIFCQNDARRFNRDDIIKESGELGLILQSGKTSYDVIWIGGSTSRYRYSTERQVYIATPLDLDGQERVIKHLRSEAAQAREERRNGARIKRGHVSPRR